MIRILILILLLSGMQNAAAQDTPPRKGSGDVEKTQPVEAQDRQIQQDTPAWPPPFTPSQNVGADSQVAFPTDI
jgi:hypothetical protein